MFRSLSPVRASSTAPTRKAPIDSSAITINIRVPSYGSVFMPFPDPLNSPDTPRTDKELFGDLEIAIPRCRGRVKCKAIRIGVRTFCRLDMARAAASGGRGGVEEDVIWLGKVEVRGGTADGVVLEEGLQRFTFTIHIPGNLAPHDYHPGHRVDNVLFAEVEGVEDTSTLGTIGSWFRRGSSPSPGSQTTSRATSPSGGSSPRFGSRSISPASSPGVMTPPQSLSILRQEVSLPQPPSYDLSEHGQEGEEDSTPWLVGTCYAERALILIYNPDPAGGVSGLDARIDTAAPGVGPISVGYTADEVGLDVFPYTQVISFLHTLSFMPQNEDQELRNDI